MHEHLAPFVTEAESEARAILARRKAVLFGHFVYAGKDHGDVYVNKDAIYLYPHDVARLCSNIALSFCPAAIDAVVGPEKGGIILSTWTAYHLSRFDPRGSDVLAVYAEKEGSNLVASGYGPLPPKHEDRFVFKRGYGAAIAGKRVLVVEDILTTGASASKVVELVKASGGTVHAVAALCNRGGVTAEMLGAPELFSLINLNLQKYPEDACPLCAAKVPINTEVGKGKEYLKQKGLL